MSRDSLQRAWFLLLALSLGSTVLAAGLPLPPALATGLLLALAWAKARVILRHFLGLAAAPGWARGFSVVIAGYLALIFALAVAG